MWKKAFFLPEDLDITGTIKPETLHRGIFDAVVYESPMEIKTSFGKPDFKNLSIADEMVIWKDAYLIFGITDLRGISDNPTFTIGDKAFGAEPSNNIGVSIRRTRNEGNAEDSYVTPEQRNTSSSNGIIVKLNWETPPDFTENERVKIKLNLKGSRRLDFVPSGKTTTVKLSGPWPDPSFDGEFLPTTRTVTENGFSASWKVLHFNRPFSQQWTQDNQTLSGADFGIKFLIPVDQYQKSIRTSKYGVLVILLTFIALFLVEITQKIRIHPF